MAYNNNNYGGGGYGGNGGYGNNNPYETRDTSFESRSANPPPSYDPLRNDGHGGHNVEMQPLNSYQPPYSQSSTPVQQHRDPNATLNECRDVSRAVDDLEHRLSDLQRRQQEFASGASTSSDRAASLSTLSAEIMGAYRELTTKVRRIKGQPDAGQPRNKPQVDALDRRLRKAIQSFQEVESDFRRRVEDQQRRQYKIVNPNATEEELREVTESGSDVQIFQQALMQSNRQGQAQSTLSSVRQRHNAIQKIEQDMTELFQLMQDLDRMIVEQDPMVENIESKAMETNQNLEAGNVEVGKAVVSARAARKKKWICLGICIAIILVVVLIVIIYLAVTGRLSSSNSNSKPSS